MSAPLVVVGDTLLDRDIEGSVERLCPDAPVPVVDQRAATCRPGGAGLAATLLRDDGHEPVVLVTALSTDAAADEARALLDSAGVEVAALPRQGPTPEKVRVRSAGRTLLRVDRGSAGRVGPCGDAAAAAIRGAGAVLVADYGYGVAADPLVRRAVAEVARDRPVVWDPHPRGPVPIAGCSLATPNRAEASALAHASQDGLAGDVARARELRARWDAAAVAITLGRGGAVVVDAGDTPLRIPAADQGVRAFDPCGAGDRFSSAVTAALAAGSLLSDATIAAVEAATAFVADGGAAGWSAAGAAPARATAPEPAADAVALAQRVRARGGTVVATGGCFDLLHAGHVRMLEAARGLGDCLIVCLNSDASVRARKGAGRPLVPAEDRAAILRSLRCVDGVAIFPEPTPERLLREVRPHTWVKGADYTIADLPEAQTVRSWGGETVVLPYLDGRSTSELLKEASRHA